MKQLIKLIAVAAPLALSLNANAATFTIANANPGDFYTNDFTNGAGSLASFFDSTGGHFIDHIQFNLATASTVTISATSTATNILLNTGDPLYSFITSGIPSLTASLAAGSYQADIKSTTGVFTGTLSVANVAAVPEPETYALMLAGLGLIGFSARRRQA